MSEEQKPSKAPERIFLKEVQGGVSSRELGEGVKSFKPSHLQRPSPVAIPFASVAGDPVEKGVKPSKPPEASRPQPVAIPRVPVQQTREKK